jgi:hypothetical protein
MAILALTAFIRLHNLASATNEGAGELNVFASIST